MGVGRPRIYEGEEDLDAAVQSYIDLCKEEKKKPTVTGATIHLGFCDKTTLYDYRDREEFSHSIKRLLLFVENGYEESLHTTTVTGSIFALKNMGWKDRTEVDQNMNIKGGITLIEEPADERDEPIN